MRLGTQQGGGADRNDRAPCIHGVVFCGCAWALHVLWRCMMPRAMRHRTALRRTGRDAWLYGSPESLGAPPEQPMVDEAGQVSVSRVQVSERERERYLAWDWGAGRG